MLVNLIDMRANQYRWKEILAVVESAAKNNTAEGADAVETNVGVQIDYAEREGISIRDAVLWAEQLQGKVTLYLYDRDEE